MGKHYKHITYSDRRLIGILLKARKSKAEIARTLGCHRSTISREIQRNYSGFGYCCNLADDQARWRRGRANKRRAKLQDDQKKLVARQLKLTLSPEQVTSLFPSAFGFTITPRTIYRHVHSLQGSLAGLPGKLRKRSKIRRRNWRRNRKPANVRRITERPEGANSRSEYGHWEMDLFVGRRGDPGAVLTLVERKSLYSVVRLLPDQSAASVLKALKRCMKPFLVKTITTDNGSEFLDHKAISLATGADIYYCHPYSAWEKGLVENTIGLYRHFFPKKQPLPDKQIKLTRAQNLVNNRPRKTLGFKTSKSLLENILS